jgi:ABC-type transport system substrate-binding protein
MTRTCVRAAARIEAAGLALFLTVAALGCGDDDGKKTEAASAGPPKKVLHFYRSEAFKSLDPVMQFDQASNELISNVYDTLVQYDYLQRPYTLQANLLTGMPELSADGLTYRFELRDDVYFHDDPCFSGSKGRKLIADDVIYSLKRFADANVNVRSYTLLHGAIAGMDEFREQTSKLGKGTDYGKLEIAGVTKVDDRHFTIELTSKNPLALYPFATSMLSIVPREAVAKYGRDFENHPVGSGPFVVRQLSRRGTIVLEKNPRYHGTYPTTGAPGDDAKGLLSAAGKKLPLLDQIELPLVEEAQPRMLKFMSGQLDWVAIDRDNFTKLAVKDDKGFHLKPEYEGKFALYAEPDLSSTYLVFNSKDPLIGKNKALRQAIAYSIDTQAFIDQMLNGRGEVLTSIVPLPIAGSQRDVPTQWYKKDLAMAKKKLAEAGYPEGKGLPPLVIEERASTTQSRQQFEFLRAELAQAGIIAQANFQTFSAFLQRVEAGNFQISEEAWGADYPDAENFYQLLYSKNKPPGPNHGAYNNPEYDRLYEQIRSMENGPERYALFAKLNDIIREELPILFTHTLIRVGLHQPWLKNFKRNIMIDVPFKYLDVDTAAKAKGRR